MANMKSRAGSFFNKQRKAVAGKMQAATTAAGSPVSMSRMQAAKDSRMAKYVTSHPYKSTAMGAMGLGAASFVTGRSRRGPGTSKTTGRPTGPYRY